MLVTFNELAERELNDAAQYYELEQRGLGGAFIADVQKCTEAIRAYPLAGSIVRGRIRRRLCQRFPYGLLYTLSHDERSCISVGGPATGLAGRDERTDPGDAYGPDPKKMETALGGPHGI